METSPTLVRNDLFGLCYCRLEVPTAAPSAYHSRYHKKQEEEKALAEDDDDTYTNSAWANPKSLKQHFSGVQGVRLPR